MICKHRLNGQYPYKALSSYPDPRGIRVGFLSRFPIVDRDDFVSFAPGELAAVPNWYPNPPSTRMGRGVLKIEVEPIAGRAHPARSRCTSNPNSSLIPAGALHPRAKTSAPLARGWACCVARQKRSRVRSYLNDLMTAGSDNPHDRAGRLQRRAARRDDSNVSGARRCRCHFRRQVRLCAALQSRSIPFRAAAMPPTTSGSWLKPSASRASTTAAAN